MRTFQSSMDLPPQKLSVWFKLGYGAAGGASETVFTLFSTFALFFLTDVVAMAPLFSGLLVAVAVFGNACTDLIVGYWSDGLKAPGDRRRPFIIGSAIPLGLFTWLGMTDFGLDPGIARIYFLFIYLLLVFSISCLEIPHLALASEMTRDYDERTGLMGLRTAWCSIGTLVGSAAPLLLVAYFSALSGSHKTGWSLMAGVIAVFCLVLVIMTWRTTKGYERQERTKRLSYKAFFSSPVKNRSFFCLVIAYTFGTLAVASASLLGVYFMTHIMAFDETRISFTMFIIAGMNIFWIPVIKAVSAKWDKRAAWLIFLGPSAFLQGVGIYFWARPQQELLFYLMVFFLTGGYTAVLMIALSMISDCTEVDEFMTGHRREGLHYGIANLVMKVAVGFGAVLIGAVLELLGYMPNRVQSPETLTGIRLLFGPLLGIFLLAGVIACYFYPLTREKHQLLLKALALKKQGKEFDAAPFADIL